MTLIFAFGICFQTPVILTILARVGFIDSAFLKRQRRYAIVIIFCIAAVLAPPDAFSMLALALPTLILYEGSIIAVTMIEKKTRREEAAKAESFGRLLLPMRARWGIRRTAPVNPAP